MFPRTSRLYRVVYTAHAGCCWSFLFFPIFQIQSSKKCWHILRTVGPPHQDTLRARTLPGPQTFAAVITYSVITKRNTQTWDEASMCETGLLSLVVALFTAAVNEKEKW